MKQVAGRSTRATARGTVPPTGTGEQAKSPVKLPGELAYWPIDRLKPYERNPRTHNAEQISKIAASLLEYGWTNPILVDSEAGIIAGHGRLLAARELGMTTVPVIELPHLTEAQKRAYVIADNRLALDAGWDEDLLAEELKALDDLDFNLALTGFDLDELTSLLEGRPPRRRLPPSRPRILSPRPGTSGSSGTTACSVGTRGTRLPWTACWPGPRFTSSTRTRPTT